MPGDTTDVFDVVIQQHRERLREALEDQSFQITYDHETTETVEFSDLSIETDEVISISGPGTSNGIRRKDTRNTMDNDQFIAWAADYQPELFAQPESLEEDPMETLFDGKLVELEQRIETASNETRAFNDTVADFDYIPATNFAQVVVDSDRITNDALMDNLESTLERCSDDDFMQLTLDTDIIEAINNDLGVAGTRKKKVFVTVAMILDDIDEALEVAEEISDTETFTYWASELDDIHDAINAAGLTRHVDKEVAERLGPRDEWPDDFDPLEPEEMSCNECHVFAASIPVGPDGEMEYVDSNGRIVEMHHSDNEEALFHRSFNDPFDNTVTLCGECYDSVKQSATYIATYQNGTKLSGWISRRAVLLDEYSDGPEVLARVLAEYNGERGRWVNIHPDSDNIPAPAEDTIRALPDSFHDGTELAEEILSHDDVIVVQDSHDRPFVSFPGDIQTGAEVKLALTE